MGFLLNVLFKGKEYKIEEKTTIEEFLKKTNSEILKDACCAKINDDILDLRDLILTDCEIKILTFKDKEGQKTFWHTTAHILAQAIMMHFKKANFGAGPAIEEGFYYDLLTEPRILLKDFLELEKLMKQIVKNNFKIERQILSYQEAKELFKKHNQKFKLELIEKLKEKNATISIYKQGDFFDLCSGPHLLSTKMVKAIKLFSLTGAYWQKDSNNQMLDRVYGISFPSKEQLKQYVELKEKAKEVDHRKLGKQLQLFSFLEEGPGFPFFLPYGVILKNSLIKYWRQEHKKAGYKEIITPTILSKKLWQTSGHWDHYKQNMYTTLIDQQEFAIKPMNCPGSILVYKQQSHSYKELPLRLCEFGNVHRHELSGTLHGLMRARCFTQDDAHIFLAKDQIKQEVKNILQLIDKIYSKFSFSYTLELATMPKDHIGKESTWEQATENLKQAIQEAGKDFKINPGDGAFYGPKIDCYLKDCLNRRWQCGTIQLDFQLPERFNLEYVAQDGKKHTPIMIHRVVYGSIERFIGILTEHFGGAFPFFMAPVQLIVLPVSDKFLEYAKFVENTLLEKGFRAELDQRDENLGYKLRQAQIRKIPLTLVVGEKEQKQKTVSVRKYNQKQTNEQTMEQLLKEIEKF